LFAPLLTTLCGVFCPHWTAVRQLCCKTTCIYVAGNDEYLLET